MENVNYGIDAPNVIKRLIGIGVVVILLVIAFPVIQIGQLRLMTSGFIWSGVALVTTGILMIFYAKFGKFKHRDRMLHTIDWKGNEKVLDVGTGLGLLMIGAAKKLTSGKAYGIDIYDKRDLSKNNVEGARKNAKLEGVAEKVEILEQNIIETNFPSNYFDVVVSNLCLHNIPKSQGRKAACAEIYRISKPGGTVIISDFIKTGQYIKNFKELGMDVERMGTRFFDTFPPLTTVRAVKK